MIIERMKLLINKLNEASDVYYNKNSQLMTDLEYDKLYDELASLENSSGVIFSNSPTQKVGYEVISELTKVRHESKILSLDKTKDVEKLASFLGENRGVLSWKLDGLTIVLSYKEGKLAQAVTRGNGEIGEDVTHNARVFANIPLSIDFKGEIVIRGEALITFSDFEKIQDEGYKNPRNLTSGTVRQLNSEATAKRNVKFFAFSLIKAEGLTDSYFSDSKHNRIKFLQGLGFETVENEIVTADSIAQTVKEFEKNIAQNDFASDGLVLTIDSISESEKLGETIKFPKDSLAFKWRDEQQETTLQEIKWNTSRTGLVNPVAIFDAVDLEGSTVSRASVHNVSIIEELELGIGDKILVYKANMIIPQIAENKTRSGDIEIPNKCPSCSEETEIRIQNNVKALYCTNPNCKAQLIRALEHFTSRDAMNIEGLSTATLEKFVAEGFVEDYTSIYELEKHENQIIELSGFGKKAYTKLIKSIEKSKSTELYRLIYALGISNVGLSNAKLLVKHFDNDIEKIKNADVEELCIIEGFGEVIAHAIVKYFKSETNLQLLSKVLLYLSIEAQKQSDDKTLEGLTFVITGDLERFKNRKQLQEHIESRGGKVTGSVTSKTSYLINNDTESSSSKNATAKKLSIPIISEQRFIDEF